jgi:hypothetical protein
MKEFCEKYGITEEQFFGIEPITGNLNLYSVRELPTGFNPTVGGYLYLYSVTKLPAGFNPTVGGSLELPSVTELPAGFNPTVGGYLELPSVTELPAGFNPTVGGYLELPSVTELPAGFNPTVGGYLELPSVTELPAGFNPTVGGSLYLNSVTELPAGFNPTVGGDLHLDSVTELPAGFNPTVGGSLYLNSVTELPAGFNPTVGGSLYLNSVTELPAGFNPALGQNLYLNGKYNNTYIKRNPNEILSWQNGRYIKADGIFTEVIHKRGNVYKVKRIGNIKESYLVTNGEFNAHGDTIKSAESDLNFKIVAEKLKSEPITPDTKLTVMYYRTLTGACDAGCRDWMRENGIPYKIEAGKTVEINPITATELLPMLEQTKPYGFEKFKELLTF